jgi:polysaccharide export outer membrane protein
LAGCQRGAYRASSLPPELAAPPVVTAQKLDVARLAGSTGGNNFIQPGDLLEVTLATGLPQRGPEVWQLQVADDGSLTAPLIGPVKVAGMETAAAGWALREAGIRRGLFRDPQVTVQRKGRRTNLVTVMGEVAEPGAYELPTTNSNLIAAIVAAGGFTPDAGTVVEVRHAGDPHAVRQVSYDGEGRPLHNASYSEDRRAGASPRMASIDLAQADLARPDDLELSDGSVVVVDKKPERIVYVMGHVNRAGQFAMPDDQELRLLDALAMAGGRTLQIADKVMVIRRHPETGDTFVIKASVRGASKEPNSNLALAPGDVVHVVETPATFTVDTLRNFVRLGLNTTATAF